MRALLRTLVGVCVLACCTFGAQDEELVKEFKRYFRKYKEPAMRIEAVLSLEGIESRRVVDALVPILKDKDPQVVDASVKVLAGFETHVPVQGIAECLEEEKNELVRIGLLRVIAAGGYTIPTEPLLECLEDRSWEVRRRGVLALAAGRKRDAVPAMVPLTEDDEPAVRSAALEALAQLQAAEVLEPARTLLEDESWQVRASAILALQAVRHRDSIGPLIARMHVEEGRLQADIGVALAELTGRNFGQRTAMWQKFWDNYGDRFEIPTDQELAKMRAAQKEAAEAYKPEGAVTYHGIESPSRKILFVIDVSGSMENEVVDKERFKDGDYPSFQRIDIVKTELQRTIENLEPYVEYNIVAFATEVTRWKKGLVRANVLNKSSSRDFIEKLEALGGSSKQDLASVGLTGSANLGAGKTNTYQALMIALEAAGRGVKDKYYQVAVDTIFFLSDGRPSTGKFVDTTDILREVRGANDLRKVVIHTIAIGEFQKSFMRQLATENGGVFVDLGR